MLSIKIVSERPAMKGWMYFWAKKVTGFNSGQHCAKCLVGPYEKRIGIGMPVNEVIDLTGYGHGDLLYICGVTRPYRWEKNFHLAVRVTGEGRVAKVIHNGDVLMLSGGLPIEIEDTSARQRFPGRGEDFLTCRNFQFAAQQFACS